MVGDYVSFFSAVEIPLRLVLRNTLTEKEPQRQKSVERSLRNIGLALFILLDRPLDIPVHKTPNSPECIRCGRCKAACPHGAICTGAAPKKPE